MRRYASTFIFATLQNLQIFNLQLLSMPKSPQKRTARMTTTPATKRRAAIEKRPRASTLITGGTGFLGSHLLRQLVEDGVKDIRVMATSIPDWLVDLGVEPLEGSITKPADVARP